MTVRITPLPEAEAAELGAPAPEAGVGALRTELGNLPLELLDVNARITGLIADVELTQGFVNTHDLPLEATYVFPLPDRGAVTRMRMEADDRVVEGVLEERSKARAGYDRAIAEGKRASIAEEERPDVFTMRVGNILPGERVTVRLTIAQPLPYADGDATFRFPLVVAPRYIPGSPLSGESVGDGYERDTDAVPDASRITPPVLLPGFPNPVRLSIAVEVDAGGLPLGDVRCSLHDVDAEGSRITLRPGARADRDFVLRLAYGEAEASATACVVDEPDDQGERTFHLTVLPPAGAATPRPRDVVVVLDRSGSMSGWKMVAARRAAARIVDTLTDTDAFAVLAFDSVVDRPAGLPPGLVPAIDRHRYRAVEHLARVEARGGTEMLTPLREAVGLLTNTERDEVLVLVTDGQVGNEDQLLRELSAALAGIRVHTIGIDRAVNAGFLTRLAAVGGGRCELVESEDRLDEAATRIHHRIAAPLLTGVRLGGEAIVAETVAPARLPDLFSGVPMVISGRWRGVAGAVTVSGRTADGQEWSAAVPVTQVANPALTAVWARTHLRDLEDRYLVGEQLEERILATSLKFGVLCRFTAFLAVDSRVVTEGGTPHRVMQPVEPASGWAMLSEPAPHFAGAPAPMAPMASFAPMAQAGRMEVGGLAATGAASLDSAAIARPQALAKAVAGRARRRPATDSLVEARAQAGDEARRMREAANATASERKALLADLSSRLDAMVIHLSTSGHASEATPLRELAEALKACDLPVPLASAELERLWQRSLEVLDAFASGSRDGKPGSSRPGGGAGAEAGRRGTAFWKRS
jgi:Ca-activated chloride channel homolog